MRKFLNEFKEFALKGSVLDLAIGVIIGAAFQSVVTSLTDNILSPLIGLFVGKNFDALSLEVLGVTLGYGAFITSVINFIIMAFVVFILVKGINKINKSKKRKADKAVTKKCPYCCSAIPEQATRCPECTSQLLKR